MTEPVPPLPLATVDGASGSWRAGRLRAAFDATFAAPPLVKVEEGPRLLLVTVGGAACAVALDECSSVETRTTITTLPSDVAAFRGLATVGGAILPVFDLALCLGLAAAGDAADLLLVSAGHPRAAFLIDRLDGHGRTTLDSDPDASRERFITVDGVSRRLLRLSAVIDGIGAGARRPSRSEP